MENMLKDFAGIYPAIFLLLRISSHNDPSVPSSASFKSTKNASQSGPSSQVGSNDMDLQHLESFGEPVLDFSCVPKHTHFRMSNARNIRECHSTQLDCAWSFVQTQNHVSTIRSTKPMPFLPTCVHEDTLGFGCAKISKVVCTHPEVSI